VDNPEFHPTELGVVASEVMWSAVLASVPEYVVPAESGPWLPLQSLAGRFESAPGVAMEVSQDGSSLKLIPFGDRDIFGILPDTAVRAAARAWEIVSW
jgi:hypothetical protein